MDDFRRMQRAQCPDGGTRAGCYGCYCCRKIRHLPTHKRVTRRLARVRLRRVDMKILAAEGAC